MDLKKELRAGDILLWSSTQKTDTKLKDRMIYKLQKIDGNARHAEIVYDHSLNHTDCITFGANFDGVKFRWYKEGFLSKPYLKIIRPKLDISVISPVVLRQLNMDLSKKDSKGYDFSGLGNAGINALAYSLDKNFKKKSFFSSSKILFCSETVNLFLKLAYSKLGFDFSIKDEHGFEIEKRTISPSDIDRDSNKENGNFIILKEFEE